MPGHLIAVLVVLGNYALLAPLSLIFPMELLLALFDAPLLAVLFLGFGGLGLFAGVVRLIVGLVRRQAWAPGWTRIVAALMSVVGALSVFPGEVLDAGNGVALVAFGLYVQWALGRADVRGWLAGPVAPPSGPE